MENQENRSNRRNMAGFPHIAARVFDTPLLIEEGKLATLLAVLGPRLGFEAGHVNAPTVVYQELQEHMLAPSQQGAVMSDAGYWIIDGTAIIPVLGTLVQRSSWMDSMSGMQSYADVHAMVDAAIQDNAVRDIILEVDSPGGEVAGAFDLADAIYNARGVKPMTAVASEVAASAAYLIASAADEIVIPRTGVVGSVGVVMAHFDQSKALEKKGVVVTHIYAGDKKVMGSKFAPLSEDARVEFQAEVDSLYELFTQTVARNRDISVAAVVETQAGMFRGFKAIDAGLADRVNTLANEVNNSAIRQQGMFRLIEQRKEIEMSQNKGGTTGPAHDPKKDDNVPKKDTSKDHETNRVPAQEPAKEPAKAPGSPPSAFPDAGTPGPGADPKDPTKPADPNAPPGSGSGHPGGGHYTGKASDERTRIKAITTHAEAEGRQALANHFAFETDLTVDQAVAALAASPKDNGKGGRLSEAMRGQSPGISSQGQRSEQVEEQPAINPNAIYAARAANVETFRKRIH